MPVQCENPSCRKSDNPDHATLCSKCRQPLPVRLGSRLSRPSAAAGPTLSFGPWLNCEPSSSSGQQISFEGHIADIINEGSRSPDSTGTRSFYGKVFLSILAGGVFGFVLVGVAALIGMMSGHILIGIAILIIGVIVNFVLISIANWILHKAAFLREITKKQNVLPPQSFTRILGVQAPASAGGKHYEVYLTSSREMNIRSPQRGDQIDLQGFAQGKKLHVTRFRAGRPL